MDLQGKVAVLTGASRGIGRALAFALAGRGCRLLLTALEDDELRAVAADLLSTHQAEVAVRSADISDDASREALVSWLRARHERPDLLINNAGGGHFERFEEQSSATIAHTLALNATAPTWLTHDLLPLLRERRHAKIVFVSSAVARLPYPGLAVYGATKAYVSSLAESLACELEGTGIRVLCFHPGFTGTAFMASAEMDMRRIPSVAISTPEKVAKRIVRAIERDVGWAYSDLPTRLGVTVAGALPARLRTRLFKNLFWELPS
jgi:short-subunit dehydrogenase